MTFSSRLGLFYERIAPLQQTVASTVNILNLCTNSNYQLLRYRASVKTQQNLRFHFMLIPSRAQTSCINDKAALSPSQASCRIVCNFMITVSGGVSTTLLLLETHSCQLSLKRQIWVWLGDGVQSKRKRETENQWGTKREEEETTVIMKKRSYLMYGTQAGKKEPASTNWRRAIFILLLSPGRRPGNCFNERGRREMLTGRGENC